MYQLVIAEKPSVAQNIASVIGASNRKDGYLEGNGYRVSWCVGHLIELANAAAYCEEWAKWSLDTLPMIPDQWRHAVKKETRKQYEILKTLMNDSKTADVVCATDAGREGELIFRLVYQMAGCKKPVKRLWISSMEDSVIEKGFQNLRDGSEFDPLYQSALCRSRADWLVGINFTRLFTILYKQRLTVGRVQTPTLAMLVEREARITAFQKEKYYIVHASDGQMDAVSEHITDKVVAMNIAENCKGKSLEVISVEQEEKVVKPPKLFDLTTLQRDANRLLGFTAQQTLEYIQALYEKKLVTYPRTDSQYLTEDMGQTVLGVINICRNRFCDEEEICAAGIKNLMDNKKVSDHHAIIPTVEVERSNLDSLPKGEQQILLLVIYRLLCAVGQPQRYQTVKVGMNCGDVSFTASGKEILQHGWKQLDTRLKKALGCKEEAEKTVILPTLDKGMHLDQIQYRISEHDTVPPKRYTEDTLLSAMENAGTEEITEDAERKGLGTPATRAAIIEKLVSGGMAERKGKQLIPTEKGIQLIKILPENVKSPKMTAEWENNLTLIAKGEKTADAFMDGIKSLVRNIVSEQKNRDETVYIGNMKCVGNCPKCGAEVYKADQKYFCKDQKCGFVLYGNNRYFQSMRKELTEEEVTQLLKEGRVKVNGLYSQKKKQLFTAIVCMDVSDKYPQFHLEFENKNQKEK